LGKLLIGDESGLPCRSQWKVFVSRRI
jgi:hypothetical protein